MKNVKLTNNHWEFDISDSTTFTVPTKHMDNFISTILDMGLSVEEVTEILRKSHDNVTNSKTLKDTNEWLNKYYDPVMMMKWVEEMAKLDEYASGNASMTEDSESAKDAEER